MVDLDPHRIAASQPELKLNKVSPLRSNMVNFPEATAFCSELATNLVNVPEVIVLFACSAKVCNAVLQSQEPCDVQMCKTAAEDRSRSNQCISDAEPAEPNLKKPMHFRCRAQMCTNCSRSNQCISDAKPKCANFSVCTEKPRSTKMHFNGEIPSARCKCARMPDAIQCSKLKTQSIQMQCQLQFSAAAVQKANHSMMLQFSAAQDSPSKNPDSRRYDAEVESSE